jgi:hypothetical protein
MKLETKLKMLKLEGDLPGVANARSIKVCHTCVQATHACIPNLTLTRHA